MKNRVRYTINDVKNNSFYQMPKFLFEEEFKELSYDAKVLYVILLDRMRTSAKSDWVDENNRPYIYFTIENIMKVMGWGNKKSVKILAELDVEEGIGLIEKQRKGKGNPTRIYLQRVS